MPRHVDDKLLSFYRGWGGLKESVAVLLLVSRDIAAVAAAGCSMLWVVEKMIKK